jgi:hypothetical protein
MTIRWSGIWRDRARFFFVELFLSSRSRSKRERATFGSGLVRERNGRAIVVFSEWCSIAIASRLYFT